MRNGQRPACAGGAASSSTRTRERCSSTRSRTCRRRRRRSCCARFRTCRSSGSAASESRRVDTRIIVATNRPLSGLVEAGRFRLGPLLPVARRRRAGAAAACAARGHRRAGPVLSRASPASVRHLQLSTAAADALLVYDWPGNVRELERVIERAVALAGSDSLELDDLPPALLGGYADVLVPSMQARESMRAWAQPVRAAGLRALRQQQASGLSRARDLLSHAAVASAVSSGASRRRSGGRRAVGHRGRS